MDVENFSFGVISSMGCFTLVVTSEESFKLFVSKVLKGELEKEFRDEFDTKNSKSVNGTVANFIDFLRESVSGMEVLFNEASYNPDNDSMKLNNWKAKDSNGNLGLTDFDCNK